GSIGAAVDGAFLGEAAVALQEELGAFAAAQFADSVTIPGHAVRPPSDSAPLGRPASVVRRERDVLDARHLEPRRLQAADGRLASRARALHPDFDFLHALRQHFARARFGGELRRERRALARAFVAHLAGARPRHDLSVWIGDRDDGVVEGRLHVRDAAHGDDLLFLLASLGFLLLDDFRHVSTSACAVPCARPRARRAIRARSALARWTRRLLALQRAALRTLARARVRARALAAHRQSLAVPQTAVAADVHEAFDGHRDLAAQRAFHLVFVLDDLAQLPGVRLAQVLGAHVRADPRLLEDLSRRVRAD